MIVNSSSIESLNIQDYQDLSSKVLNRNFGRDNDTIELTILNNTGDSILTDSNFNDYTPILGVNTTEYKSIDIDYVQVLNNYGFTNGQYKLKFSFQRKLVQNTTRKIFNITEISPSRTEIRAEVPSIEDSVLSNSIYDIQNQLFSSAYVKDFNLNFGNGLYALILNIQLDNFSSPNTVLFKLYRPLPSSIGVGSSFRVIEEIINPIEIEIDLGNNTFIEDGISLQGPNFNLDLSNNTSIQSEFRSYDDILQNGAVSSSFNNLANFLSGSFPLNLDFTNTNTTSGYHFENFIHFSSATERLKNFEYKMRLIESYRDELSTLSTITGDITSSVSFIKDKDITENKINNIIQNFDPYERFLYFESGTFCWPKYDNTKPYSNVSSSTAAAVSWLGTEIIGYPGQYTGGQLLSASLYDDYNVHLLINTLPDHIRENNDNEQFLLFVEMVAHHFDNIWNYIESINDINKADSSLTKGISKEFIFDALKNTGIPAFDQFENTNLFEYILGGVKDGTFQYAPTDGTTMVTASDAGSIPKGDITKEVWKRLYHNAPYLLKTKGTERGIKALMACYGIPESMLHIKEYGGPTVDKTGFRIFSYQKESKALNAINSTGPASLISINDGLNMGSDNVPKVKTIQTRILPNNEDDIIPIISLVNITIPDLTLFISRSIDSNIAGDDAQKFGKLVITTGSAADDSFELATKFISSDSVPFYNGDMWNISLLLDSGSSNNITAYATSVSPNKNLYTCSIEFNADTVFEAATFSAINLSFLPKKYASFLVDQSVSSSLQEVRLWSEKLNENTIYSQSFSPFNYNGNTISSSYESLLLRLPLGSDLKQVTESFVYIKDPSVNKTPNINILINENLPSTSGVYRGEYVSISETHHLTTPDTVGSGMVSDKVRIDSGSIDENWLSPFFSVETSPQDRQPLDYSDLGVFFSPTFEINEDIIYTLGAFRLDDYIGDPKHYTSSFYPDLKEIKDIYTQKLERRYNFYDYIRTIQFFDHTLFKVIKSFTPAKANLKTGLVIEPHYLERAKIPGKNIIKEQQTEYLLSYSPSGSISSINEIEHLVNIDVVDYIESGSYGSATENVAQVNNLSSKYYIVL